MIFDIPNNLGWVDSHPSTVHPSYANANEENRMKFVTDMAAISRGKSESANPKKRYEALLKEAAPDCVKKEMKGVPGRPLEFLPVRLKAIIYPDSVKLMSMDYKEVWNVDMHSAVNSLLAFSFYIHETGDLYTNMRALLLSGVPYRRIPYNKPSDMEHFRAVKVKAPYFVFAQIRTHGRISQTAASVRVLDENEIWIPGDFIERLSENDGVARSIAFRLSLDECSTADEIAKALSERWGEIPVVEMQAAFKELGYKAEVWRRFPQYALYKHWTMAGWMNDSRTWSHLIIERNAHESMSRKWVQKETELTVVTIRKAIGFP